jgi:hypothetical protein
MLIRRASSGVTATISSSSITLNRFVSAANAVIDEARNVSPSPTPISSGQR